VKRSQRGNDRDVRVRKVLEELGYTVGSRRHVPGAGDLLGVRPTALVDVDVVLVEVKSTAGGPWEHFSPAERLELAEAARDAGGTGYVAWWPPHGCLSWFEVLSRDPGKPCGAPSTMDVHASPASGHGRDRPGAVAPPTTRSRV
jgi:hypothetical protein